MRIATLYSIFVLLGTTAAHLAPVSESGLLSSGVHARSLQESTAANWHHLARDNGNGASEVETTVSAVGRGDTADADVLVVAAVRDGDGVRILGDGLGEDRNAQLLASLPSLGFTGSANSVIRVPGQDGNTVLVVGMGSVEGEPSHEKLRQAAGNALRSLHGVNKVAVLFPTESEESLSAVTEGAALGAYTFSRFKTLGVQQPASEIVVASGLENAADVVRRADVLSQRVKAARRLVSTPSNELFPEDFVDKANEAAAGIDNISIEVWDENRLQEEGMNLIYTVGQGSAHPPRMIKVSYTPDDANGHIALVGKGITFDTGGISIKPSAGMAAMKGDMAGAATVLHATLAAAELGLNTRVTAWLCIAENMPDGNAQRPGDIWTAYNGQTVEITNTDAEGRLVMADGMAKAVEEGPDLLFDIATLTGAAVVALGNRVAGLMGDAPAIEALERAASATGEGVWAMPFPEEMFDDMTSRVADYVNAGSSPGGMLKGGIFLKPFAEGATWAHLDIAGPSFNDLGAYGYTPIEGTGFGLRTLVKAVEQFGQ